MNNIPQRKKTNLPAIRREFADVLSIRTATNSHSSPDVDVSDAASGVPLFL